MTIRLTIETDADIPAILEATTTLADKYQNEQIKTQDKAFTSEPIKPEPTRSVNDDTKKQNSNANT
jgi:hypothetical protein